MSTNTHQYNTRSKLSSNSSNNPSNNPPAEPADIDEHGNIQGLIDYQCDAEFDKDQLYKELSRLSNGSITMDQLTPKKKQKKQKNNKKVIIIEESADSIMPDSPKKAKHKVVSLKRSGSKSDLKSNKQTELGGLLMTYILAKANETIKKKPKRKLKLVKVESNESIKSDANDIELPYSDGEASGGEDSDIELSDDEEIIEDDIDLEELTDKTTTSEELDSDFDVDEEDTKDSEEDDDEEDDESEGSEDSEVDEYDEHDDEYNEIVEKYMTDNTEDGNLDYFHGLKEEEKLNYIEEIKKVYSINSSNIPLKFKVLNSDMDLYTKSIAVNNLDKLSEMDISTGEYNKMDQWINGLIRLPFGKVTELPVKNSDEFEKKRDYIQSTLQNMDKAIYGHKEAKTHILQVIGKWIRKPDSLGNVLAIQGPMGNGKTTLIKNGIAKSLNRPFEFVALGGASDSAFFEGHSYTYEGSRWGRIVDILHKCGSMNPIICFDELDKVSDTPKGDEIINMLIHMTDSSQNTKFQDNYFPGIDIDLSKVLFIFSFNDESKINRILKDRMYVIRTKGYDTKDKLQIAHNYLLPEIYGLFDYTKEDIVFSDEIITDIISKYTAGEEGVRNLKRCLENIVSTLNIYHLTKSDDKDDIIDMKIKDFKLPITLKQEHITSLLKVDNSDKPPEHMYM